MSESLHGSPEEEYSKQIEVFGAERMAELPQHSATVESTEHLLNAINVAANQPGYREFDPGVHNSELKKRGGKPNSISEGIFVISNPAGTAERMFSTDRDRALGRINGFRHRQQRIVIPRGSLKPAVYSIDEEIYVDANQKAKISRQYRPLARGIVSGVLEYWADGLFAVKDATEQEVQEALELLTETVSYNDELRAKEKSKKPTYGP